MSSGAATLQNSGGRAGSEAKPGFWRSPYMRIGGSAAILVLLLTFLPVQHVWATMKRIPPGVAVALLGVYLGLHLLGVVKWRLLINVAGADIRFIHAVRCYYGGLFANIFLPSLVGGDVVRAGMAFLVSRSRAAIVLGSLADRAQDVAGLAAVSGIGVLLLPGALDYQAHKSFWNIIGLLTLAGVLGVGSLFIIPARKFPMKVRRIMVKLRRGIRSMYSNPGRMFLCFSLGMGLQISQVGVNYALGEIAGLHIPVAAWLFAWPLAKLSALLPITQGGIGVREVALVALLSQFGAPPAPTAAVGLSFQAIVIIGGFVAGMTSLVLSRLFPAGAPPAGERTFTAFAKAAAAAKD